MAKQTKVYQHNYPSDLTDAQWAALAPLLRLDPDEPARTYAVRDIVDAIFYFNGPVVPGAIYQRTYRPGRMCSTTSTSGREMAPGNG
jgi:hypothetical protein